MKMRGSDGPALLNLDPLAGKETEMMKDYDALMAYLAKETYEEQGEAQWPLELHESEVVEAALETVPEVSFELDACVPF